MFKIKDERGSTLYAAKTETEAIQWYNNNDDIATTIDPEPSEEALSAYQTSYVSKAQASEIASLSPATNFETREAAETYATPGLKLVTAAEAAARIRLINEAKYDVNLAVLIEQLIDKEGTVEATALSTYEIKKLTLLGYYVRKHKEGHTVTVLTEPTVVTTANYSSTAKTNEDLYSQLQLTKLHKPK